jgi:NhaP-type Na+/H+ or K+/H+ antiporter
LVNKFTRESVPLFWQKIIMIEGMRGTMALALVISLPQGEMKNSLETITFGVVLPSLVMRYIALPKYIKRVHGKFDNIFS